MKKWPLAVLLGLAIGSSPISLSLPGSYAQESPQGRKLEVPRENPQKRKLEAPPQNPQEPKPEAPPQNPQEPKPEEPSSE